MLHLYSALETRMLRKESILPMLLYYPIKRCFWQRSVEENINKICIKHNLSALMYDLA